MIGDGGKKPGYGRPLLYAIAVGAVASLLASINFPFGFAEDTDSFLVIDNALQFPEEGYQRSRTWGFPLYELAVYPIIQYLDIFYAKLYSLIFFVLASVLVLVPLFVCVLMRLNIRQSALVVLAVAIFIPNLIQVNLFERTELGGLNLDVSISPGAIAQDRSDRLQNEYINGELGELMDAVARDNGFEEYETLPAFEAGTLVIMPEEMLRHYSADRFGGQYYKALASGRVKVVVYPMPSHRGWQQFIEFERWREIGPEDFREVKEPPVL